MKKSNKGYMLAETLVVTTFVAGVLVFLFIQFNNLNNSYNESYNFNTVEAVYSLNNIKEYLITDANAIQNIKNKVTYDNYLDITNCRDFTDVDYCKLLFEVENVKNIYVTNNNVSNNSFDIEDGKIHTFVSKIKVKGNEKYRLIAEFNDETFATIRFGD